MSIYAGKIIVGIATGRSPFSGRGRTERGHLDAALGVISRMHRHGAQPVEVARLETPLPFARSALLKAVEAATGLFVPRMVQFLVLSTTDAVHLEFAKEDAAVMGGCRYLVEMRGEAWDAVVADRSIRHAAQRLAELERALAAARAAAYGSEAAPGVFRVPPAETLAAARADCLRLEAGRVHLLERAAERLGGLLAERMRAVATPEAV